MTSLLKNSLMSACVAYVVSSCTKIEHLDPRESSLGEQVTKVLAHRGAGLNSPVFRENTLEGIKYGLQKLEGVEVDIAISEDGGLWLSHDSEILTLNKAFIKARSHEIEEIKDEDGLPYYDSLEDVLAYMAKNEPTKYISLDVKYPSKILSFDTYKSVAKTLAELTEIYNFENRISVQSGFLYFLNKVGEESSEIETYYMSYGNFDKGVIKAYDNHLTGLSFDHKRVDELTEEGVDHAHSLGIKVLVYSVDDVYINEVYGFQVDFMETDNMDFYELLNI
ncbi:MAG: glycerophosphoryl diester phosphodiesterase [Algoriphagus sp.]